MFTAEEHQKLEGGDGGAKMHHGEGYAGAGEARYGGWGSGEGRGEFGFGWKRRFDIKL